MKWVKRIVWVAILGAAGVGAFFAFQPKPVQVEMSHVSRGPLQVTIDEDGKTRIKEKYIVSTPVSGRLRRIELREGDPVHIDETVLASIQPSDPDLLDARALAQAEARVRAAEAAVERAKAVSERTQVELGLAESELNRFKQLIRSKSISQSDFDQKQAEFRSQGELYRSAEFAEDIAEFELEMAQAALVHVQPAFDGASYPPSESIDFDIHSPIEGVVLRVLQESSTVVTPGTPIVELGDHQDLEVVVDVLSTDAVKITNGTRCFLEQWGGNRSLPGTVRLVEPSAFEKISALGVEEQRVNIIIDFDEKLDESAPLGDGYRVEARLIIWSADDVLKVPTSALFREANDWAVFVVDGDSAYLKLVEIGHRNDREAEVLSGLEIDDRVVLHPGDNLFDGAMVVERQTR